MEPAGLVSPEWADEMPVALHLIAKSGGRRARSAYIANQVPPLRALFDSDHHDLSIPC